jgi:hypothetical protein
LLHAISQYVKAYAAAPNIAHVAVAFARNKAVQTIGTDVSYSETSHEPACVFEFTPEVHF